MLVQLLLLPQSQLISEKQPRNEAAAAATSPAPTAVTASISAAASSGTAKQH